MRRQVNNFISVAYTAIKFCLLKVFHGKNFKFDIVERFSPNVVTEFNKGSHVQLGKMVRVHSGSKIKVRSGAQLFIGANTRINYNCIIACHDCIRVGEGTEFGPAVFVYDHDHDYRVGLKENRFKTAPIVIGRNCWIGANCIILRGTEIGDNSVVGAGTVVKGIYAPNSLIVSEKKNRVECIEFKRAGKESGKHDGD